MVSKMGPAVMLTLAFLMMVPKAQAQSQPTDASLRQLLHPWQRYVRGFRRGHNFSFSVGATQGHWQIKSFGSLEPGRYSGSGIYSKFHYSFHLPIKWGLGYFVGSSVGYHFEAAETRQDFKPVPSYMFPGILAGLVFNVTPSVRVMLGADAFLERYNGLAERDDQGEDRNISVTMRSYDIQSGFEIFYDINWALRFEYHYRISQYFAPREIDVSESTPVDVDFNKQDQWIGFGISYHLI